MGPISISVVIIGRNAANQLCRYQSERDSLAFADEVLYVDSASEDESVSLAQSFGWRVFRLNRSSVLSAAAGRHVGALEARGRFIVFLDSDMQFVSELPESQIRNGIMAQISEGNAIGWAGNTVDYYPSGNVRPRLRKHVQGSTLPFFGGFVCLRRTALLEAGNWHPSVLANEEIELYARLRARGWRIQHETMFWCRHYTTDPSAFATLRSAYLPLTSQERKFFGSYGHALRAAWNARVLRQLFWIAPEPLLTLFCLVLLFSPLPMLATIPLALLVVVVCRRRSPLYLVVCPARVLHLLVGLFTFRDAGPTYETVARSTPVANLESQSPEFHLAAERKAAPNLRA